MEPATNRWTLEEPIEVLRSGRTDWNRAVGSILSPSNATVSVVALCIAGLMTVLPASAAGQADGDADVETTTEQASDTVRRSNEVAGAVADREGAEAGERPQQRQLSLFSTTDTGGSLATPRCRESDTTPDEELHYARMVQAWSESVTEAERNDAPKPIAVHLGDSTFPGPIGRFLLAEEQLAEGAETLTSLLARVPYAAHLVGNAEIGLEVSGRTELFGASRRTGLPFRAANVVCSAETGGEAVCEGIGNRSDDGDRQSYDLVQRGEFRVAIVSLLDPAVEDRVAASRMAGLDILAPGSQLHRSLEQIQKASDEVDLVVAQFHAADDRSPTRSMELARSVDGVDVLMTNSTFPAGNAGDEASSTTENGYTVAPGTGTVIVGTQGGTSNYVTTRLTLERKRSGDNNENSETAGAADASTSTTDWTIRNVESHALSTKGLTPDPGTAEALRAVADEFCQTWGRPVADAATIDQPMERESFKRYVLNTMRFATESEVALINDGALANASTFPIRNQLTLADIYTALPYNNELVVARVSGDKLATWAGRLNDRLSAAGLTADGNINGRSIRPNRRYRVATNRYVAEGGDDLVESEAFDKSRSYEPTWSDGAPPISEIVVNYVRSGAFQQRGAVSDRIDPTGNFPDLSRKLFWAFTGSLNASYDQITVANPGDEYTQSQLTNNDTQQVNLEFSGAANADSRNHGWDNSLKLQYARARVSQDGQAGTFEETKDLIRGKSAYKFTGIRANLGNVWWAPIPTGELQVESEFDAPDERNWHKLELTGIAGASFELFEPFEVTIGANVRGDLNAPESQTGSTATSGLAASYKLDRIDLLPILGSPIKFESELEYFYNDIRRDDIHELRNTNRLYYSLLQNLYFTSTFSAFLYQNTRDVGDLGSHTELTFGLNYLFDGAIQTF